MKKRSIILVCTVVFWAHGATVLPQKTDPDIWKPLQFLIGTWEAKTTGGSSGAVSTGTYSFQLELRNHILSRHTIAADCKGPADYNCEHSDLLYVYQDAPGKPYRAIFFDNEGHVIHYGVSVPHPASVAFTSDPSTPGPEYRLSYELKGEVMFGKFDIRMPGRTEFTTYLEWSGGRK